jgi:hypothetical protein
MPALDVSWPWLSLVLLGAFHGLNPAMGWLFAVAIGFQERRLRAVMTALAPITLGHALSIGLVAVPVGLLGLVIPQDLLMMIIGLTLLGFAAYKSATRFRHPRWVGMRVRPRQLVLWSFLMASAHGAGLMLAPVLARMRNGVVPSALAEEARGEHLMPDGQMMQMPMEHLGHAGHQMPAGVDALGPALASVALHSAAMLAVAGTIAVVVYWKVGVDVLRRAWINLDLIWFGVFLVTGGVTLGLGVWAYLPK